MINTLKKPSFFGGDLSKSHFSVGLRYSATPNERETERRPRRKAERETLIAAGIKTETYFEFRNDDLSGKEAAKVRADALAASIERRTGVKMSVCEGCFL